MLNAVIANGFVQYVTYLDLDVVLPVPCGRLVDDLSPVSTVTGSNPRITPVHTCRLQFFIQSVLPCLLLGSPDLPHAIFWFFWYPF